MLRLLLSAQTLELCLVHPESLPENKNTAQALLPVRCAIKIYVLNLFFKPNNRIQTSIG